jgi:hypothetical protein
MTKRILSVSLLAVICFTAIFSCKKTPQSNEDATRNYFPLTLGKYVTYSVDSVYYHDNPCVQYERKLQMKYAISDTFTDKKKRLSYIMDVFSRPYDGGDWKQTSVILITPTPAPLATINSPAMVNLLYTQDQTQYIKLMFPIANGFSWAGNQYANVGDSAFMYLKNWSYTYQNMGLSYFNGLLNFDKTVTVMEDDESVNYPDVNGGVPSYRTFAKEVYAYNVGMIYKEWEHWTYKPNNAQCLNGYRVVMQAIDHN